MIEELAVNMQHVYDMVTLSILSSFLHNIVFPHVWLIPFLMIYTYKYSDFFFTIHQQLPTVYASFICIHCTFNRVVLAIL